MGSVFTFALGAVSALVLMPMIFSTRKHRYHHRHGGPAVNKSGGRGSGLKGR